MEHITDPKILAIMAKLNQSEGSEEKAKDVSKKKEKGNDDFRPPTTYEEFLKAEKLVIICMYPSE